MTRIRGGLMLCALVLTGALSPMNVRAQTGTSQVSPSVQQHVEQRIQPLLDEMTVAANAHDTDRFLAAYLHQPELVFVFNGEVIRGLDSVRTLQLKWWNNGKSDVVYAERVPAQITALTPDIAIVVQAMKSQRTLPSGAVSSGNFAITQVWQKRPEGWRIIQVHESTAR
ncbi:MAG: nuclear transport factor 2 family protein [Gemmatimonadaceae bacterium]